MMQWISQVDLSYKSQEGLEPPVYNYCEEVIFESDLRWHLVVL